MRWWWMTLRRCGRSFAWRSRSRALKSRRQSTEWRRCRLLASGSDFDLILIDWNMPEMDGFELLRRIRPQPRYDRTKIMMVTTETGMGQMSEALAAGANEYIMKPFTFDVVRDKLRLLGL